MKKSFYRLIWNVHRLNWYGSYAVLKGVINCTLSKRRTHKHTEKRMCVHVLLMSLPLLFCNRLNVIKSMLIIRGLTQNKINIILCYEWNHWNSWVCLLCWCFFFFYLPFSKGYHFVVKSCNQNIIAVHHNKEHSRDLHFYWIFFSFSAFETRHLHKPHCRLCKHSLARSFGHTLNKRWRCICRAGTSCD